MSAASMLSKSLAQPFDCIADCYDVVFTDSVIGKAQRTQVAAEANRRFHPGDHVLELNCGTGHDALALAVRGVNVTAYDASAAMIDIANRKLQAANPRANVTFGVLSNERVGLLSGSFDGALSNFAGMNCCYDWARIASDLADVVRPGGHVLLCIMGRMCLWEILYFLLRGEPGKAFRRATRHQSARIGESRVDVYYASVREAQQAFSSGFNLRSWQGIGVFVPPSFCEPHFKKRMKTVKALAAFDRRLGHIPGIRCWADHVLLDFVRHPQ